MPLVYDNSVASISEVTVNTSDLPIGRDWTKGASETLVLWFYGDPANAATERMYVKVNGVKVPYPGDAADIARPQWNQWNVDLSAFGVDLSNVTQLSIGFERTGVSGGAGTVLIDDILLYQSAPEGPSEEIWLEAESAAITAPMKVYDDPAALGGKYIGTDDNGVIGDRSDGIATYNFTVQGGIYKMVFRTITAGDADSFWVRIPGAAMNTTPPAANDGFVRFNSIAHSDTWIWDEVHNDEDGSIVVQFTLDAGIHTLEVAYREDGALLDAVVITKID